MIKVNRTKFLRVAITALALAAVALVPLRTQRTRPNSAREAVVIVKPQPLDSTGSGYGIAFDWQYTASLPACGSTLAACYDGFQMTDVTTGQQIGGVGISGAPIGPTALSFNWTPAGGAPYGTSTYSLVAHGYDENGTVILSAPATVSVTIPVTTLNGPTGLVGVKQ